MLAAVTLHQLWHPPHPLWEHSLFSPVVFPQVGVAPSAATSPPAVAPPSTTAAAAASSFHINGSQSPIPTMTSSHGIHRLLMAASRHIETYAWALTRVGGPSAIVAASKVYGNAIFFLAHAHAPA